MIYEQKTHRKMESKRNDNKKREENESIPLDPGYKHGNREEPPFLQGDESKKKQVYKMDNKLHPVCFFFPCHEYKQGRKENTELIASTKQQEKGVKAMHLEERSVESQNRNSLEPTNTQE